MSNTIRVDQHESELIRELEELRARVQELEDSELQRVSDEQERFDSLQVLDEYAKQLEESRDKLMRLFKAAADVQEAKSVQDALEKVAAAVNCAGWGSVSVSLYDNFEIVQSAYAGCTPSDIEFLETHRRSGAERARMYGPDFECFKISRSYFVPADRVVEVMPLENVCPGRREVQPGDEWDPMDLAYVPLYGANDAVIGCINCDDPLDGKRPTREVFFYLELFAELVAHKVETARLMEQKLVTEEALRQSETHYRTVFNYSGDSFFVLDQIFRDCNEKACELFGCTREDIVGHMPAEHSPEYQPDGRLSTIAAEDYINKALSGAPQTFPWTHKRKDGTLIDCEVSLSSMRIGAQNLLFAVVRDVTDRRRAEQAIRQSEERFRNVFESSPIGVAISASDGRYQNVNGAICRMLGYEHSELIGKSFAEITHPEDLDDSFQMLHRLLNGEVDNICVEKRYLHKSGETIWTSVNVCALRDHDTGGVYFMTQAQDITERKRAESERGIIVRILQIVNTTSQPDEMIDQIFAEVGRLVPAANRFLALFDAQREMISFPYFVDEMDPPPPEVPLGKGLTSWVIRHGRPLRLNQQDFERISANGEIELMGSPAFSWLGVPLIANSGVVGALVVQSYRSTGTFDANHERILSAVAAQIASVIERQRIEQDLMKLKRAVQTSGDVIFMTDRDGTITYANPEFTRLYGFSADEVVGKQTPRVLKSGRVPPAVYEQVWQQLCHGQLVKGEIINRTKDGRFVTVEASANPILDDDGTIMGFLGVQRDISQRKVTEHRLAKLNECFLSFGVDPVANINRLVAVCGELSGADAALYNYRKDNLLCTIGQWQLPADYIPVDKAAGHICGDTILHGAEEQLFVVRNLPNTDYYRSDPNVARYGLQTYVGTVVKNGEKRVGSLCVLYRRDFAPTDEIAKLMGIIASAIGAEEVRHHSEAALRESEERFRLLYDQAPIAYQSLDISGCLIHVNQTWLNAMGYEREEVLGMWFGDLLTESYVDCFRERFPRFIEAGEVHGVEFDMRRKDGSVISVSFEGHISRDELGHFRQTHCVMRDVTEQKRTQAELLRKTNELESIFRALPDLYFRIDQAGTILDYRAGRADDLYTTPEVFLNRAMRDVLPPDVGAKFTSAFEQIVETGEPVSLEYDLVIDHKRKTFEARVMPLREQQQFVAVVRNVTESRHVLSALKESEVRFRVLADTVPAMIWMSGADRRFVFVNGMWEEFTGRSADQAKGEGWSAAIHPDDLKRVLDTYRSAFDRRMDFTTRCRMLRNDGQYRWILLNGRSRLTAGGRFVGYIGTCVDVTDRPHGENDIL